MLLRRLGEQFSTNVEDVKEGTQIFKASPYSVKAFGVWTVAYQVYGCTYWAPHDQATHLMRFFLA